LKFDAHGHESWLVQNISRFVGLGFEVSFWNDLWIGDLPLKAKFPRLFQASLDPFSVIAEMGFFG
jgi:hypothetical protein